MGVSTAASSKLYIGNSATSAVDTAGEFEDLNLIEVGEIESIGAFGDQAQLVTFTSLSERRVKKFKGAKDAGDITLTLGRDPSDTGQAAIRTAEGTDFDYGFKVTLNDGSDGSPSSPTTFYFRGKVMGYTTEIGDANSVVMSSVTIAITSEIIELAAV